MLVRYGPAQFAASFRKVFEMAHASVPHFHNTDGLRQIEVGSKEFMCVGALPPFDHPHIYLDMGKDTEIVCPYCSTLYVYSSKLAAGTSSPLSAVFEAA